MSVPPPSGAPGFEPTAPDFGRPPPAGIEAPSGPVIPDAPAPEPTAPSHPDAALTERPHPLSPLVKGWIAVAAVIFFLVQDLPGADLSRITEMWWIYALVILGAFVLPLVSGYFNWRFTRFVIDDEQVRIERRFISHRSDRIAFTKIQSVDVTQPLIARLLGLAGLHIDVGSGGSAKSIEFLRRERAYQLRDYLIARAQGSKTTVDASAHRPVGDAFSDAGATDRIVVQVPNQRLLGSIVVSGMTFSTLVIGGIGVAAAIIWDQPEILFGSVFALPWLFGLVSMVFGRLRNEFSFTLTAAGSGGLRITRGLTALVSQTIPLNRIQGIDITRPLFWRPFGWHRVRLDVLGLGAGGDEEKLSSTLLLPVGTAAEVQQVLRAVWPQVDIDEVEMHHIPRRAKWLRWFDVDTWQWGYDEQVLVAMGGLLSPNTSIVPHARVQSVRLIQGPLQRLIGLASVQAHTTPGPVELVCRHLDANDARDLALGELDRMRAARLRIAPNPTAGHFTGRASGVNPALQIAVS